MKEKKKKKYSIRYYPQFPVNTLGLGMYYLWIWGYIYIYIYIYTGCPRRKGPNFGRVFLMSNYTDITRNTYIPKFDGYGDIGQRSLKL